MAFNYFKHSNNVAEIARGQDHGLQKVQTAQITLIIAALRMAGSFRNYLNLSA